MPRDGSCGGGFGLARASALLFNDRQVEDWVRRAIYLVELDDRLAVC
jgi:hypothetical protein